jgi:anti-sigma factor RsiW
MHNQTHPDTEQLDQYRAGLLDEAVDEKSALEKHLAGCRQCRDQLGSWRQLGPAAPGSRHDTGDLSDALKERRRLAMQAGSKRRYPVFPSLATAAALLVAVSIGLWNLTPNETETDYVATLNTDSVPDIYEDLDFYLWLANQKESNDNDIEPDGANRT